MRLFRNIYSNFQKNNYSSGYKTIEKQKELGFGQLFRDGKGPELIFVDIGQDNGII